MEVEAIISVVLFFTIVLGWGLFNHLKNLYQNQNMYKKVGWIAEKENNMMCYNSSISLRNQELISHIFETQKKLEIPKEFRIDYSNETEKADVEEILNLHKNDVIKSYFHGFLSKSKNICNLNSLEYYFYSLYCFIYKELEDYKHYQDKIYFEKEYTDNTHFNCQLTDYGRAFYKIYLISHMFIVNNEKTRKLFEYINPNLKKHITDYLEKNKVGFWSQRP